MRGRIGDYFFMVFVIAAMVISFCISFAFAQSNAGQFEYLQYILDMNGKSIDADNNGRVDFVEEAGMALELHGNAPDLGLTLGGITLFKESGLGLPVGECICIDNSGCGFCGSSCISCGNNYGCVFCDSDMKMACSDVIESWGTARCEDAGGSIKITCTEGIPERVMKTGTNLFRPGAFFSNFVARESWICLGSER